MIELVFMPLYALADRFAGGGAPKLDAKLPGRAAFWGALICAGAGYLIAGLYGALLAAAWLLWRTPAWSVVPGGSMTPKTMNGYAGTFVRHLLVVAPVAAVAYWTDRNVLASSIPFVGFAGIATLLAILYGRAEQRAIERGEPIGNQNARDEIIRGAAFGAAIVVSLQA